MITKSKIKNPCPTGQRERLKILTTKRVIDVGIFTLFIFLSGFNNVFGATPPGQLVPKCGADCGWQQLVELARNLLNFFIYIAVPLAAIAFVYAGWLYLSARGNPGQITKAHGIFMNVAVGLFIVLIAWLVVDQIMKALVISGSYVQVMGAPAGSQ